MARSPKAQSPSTPQAQGYVMRPEDAAKLGIKPAHEEWSPFQIRVLNSMCDEIALLGGKGSGKSTIMRAFLIRGNPDRNNKDEKGNVLLNADTSYIYHPDYRGLILRKNERDLADFIQRAYRLYKTVGGIYSDGSFHFPAGAVIDCGHMKDRTSWQKYIGIEYQRIAIDEAGLIPEYESYEELKSCMRTPHPDVLRRQIILASNAGGPGTCVRQGEVLTPSGWKDIKEFRVGDPIYTIDSERNMTESRVEQVHQFAYDGPLSVVQQRGFFMECTPDHKVAYVPRTAGISKASPFKLERFDHLPHQACIVRTIRWGGTPLAGFSLEALPKERGRYSAKKQPLCLSAKQYMTLMGWFLSEGFTVKDQPHRKRRLFGIAQGKSPQKQKLEDFLKECGFRYSRPKGSASYQMQSHEWALYFRQFGKAPDKFIPQSIKNATPEQLGWLLDSLMDGDGTWGRVGSSRKKDSRRLRWKESGAYFTSSKRLADDVAEVCTKLGYSAYITSRFRKPSKFGREGRFIHARILSYEVNFKTTDLGVSEVATGHRTYKLKREGSRPRGSDVSYEHYTGPVYCLGVPDTHTFLIRQKGSCWVSGNCWLMDRFMNIRDREGRAIPHDTKIRETYTKPDGTKEYRTRIWMFSTLEDNPVYRNSSYAVDLMALQDPKKRAAYLEGKWDALFGSYFGDVFRPNGPHTGEPANADHVVHKVKVELNGQEVQRYPVEIKHWWPRHIGFDWGYSHESAILWGARAPDGRIYVYREMVQSQLSAYRAGYEIAMASRSELEQLPSKSMTIWMGQDAFGQRGGDRSYAELVAMGIASVLGQDAVHLPDFIEKRIREAYEMHVSNPLALNQRDEAIQHLWTQRRIGITIRKAEKASTIGWQHMREMMRWESTGAINANFDRELYFKILREDGEGKANEYAKVYRDIRPEVLPKLQIFDCCQRVISSIPKLQHKEGEEAADDKHFVGRDVVDSTLYLLLGIRDSKSDEPYEEYRDKHITEIKLVNPNMDLNDLIWVNRRLEEQWQSKSKPLAPYTPPRHARIQRMLAQGKIKGPNMIDKVYHRL